MTSPKRFVEVFEGNDLCEIDQIKYKALTYGEVPFTLPELIDRECPDLIKKIDNILDEKMSLTCKDCSMEDYGIAEAIVSLIKGEKEVS